ncbi:hypothetical protein FHR32_003766 [Streptosporangium album]|uniref:Multicopper oxidase n=2 Tax=Streptosporangium album TaxID=47479 RepID=A0A7W7RY39_9ACTN|nr:hypothetical protein [Streptosporangium album]MBB4939461.1 hypothetical protein [Streptosporangium album]
MTVAWGFWASDLPGRSGAAGLGCLGPTLVARRDRPSIVRYRNQLPARHLLQRSIDQTLWRQVRGVPPDPPGGRHLDMPHDVTVWNVVHLHGGWNPPQSDGNPAAWFTPHGLHGPLYATLPGAAPNEAIYAYGNRQRATMLWYHDHGMDLTRLNNYAGLAGVYVIREQAEDTLGLPQGRFEVPLIVQDRTFNRDGSLFYPAKGVTPYHPIWSPEVFGDTPIVNGKAYPFLAVEPRRYRLRVLNASNSRFYHLWFGDGRTRLPFWLIGIGGGLRDHALRCTDLLMAPADRADIVIDFASVPFGSTLTLMNDAAAPYPGGGGGPAGRPTDLDRRTAGGARLQRRDGPGHRRRQGAEARSAVPCRSDLPAAGYLQGRQRPLIDAQAGIGLPRMLEELSPHVRVDQSTGDVVIRPPGLRKDARPIDLTLTEHDQILLVPSHFVWPELIAVAQKDLRDSQERLTVLIFYALGRYPDRPRSKSGATER